MKPLEELYEIVANQKTVRTSRLKVIVSHLARGVRTRNEKIRNQQKTIEHLNRGYNHQRDRAERLQKRLDKLEGYK